MKYLPMILIILFSCQIVKFGDEQYGRTIINSDTVRFHVNIYGDTTWNLTQNEEVYLKTVLIDSLHYIGDL